MNSFLRLPLLATALLGLATSPAHAQTAAYVETASLSILWNFTATGISGTTIGPTPIEPGAPGAIDPDKLRPADRITTDTGSLIVHTLGNGNQAFFTAQLIRSTLERYAEEYRALAIERDEELKPVKEDIKETEDAIAAVNNQLSATVDPEARAALIATRTNLEAQLADLKLDVLVIENEYAPRLASLENNIAYLKREATGRWELTSVREPQSTVAGATSTPFKVFLTRIEPSRGRSPTRTFDTRLRIIPLYSAGTSVETLSSGLVTKATGSYTTHFRLAFSSLFTTDPLSALDEEDRATAIEGEDYNTAGDIWFVAGTGYMTYSLRTTPGPLAAVLPTRVKITGHGSWSHLIFTPDTGSSFSGIAPLSIKMGDIKYQDRHLFPDINVAN